MFVCPFEQLCGIVWNSIYVFINLFIIYILLFVKKLQMQKCKKVNTWVCFINYIKSCRVFNEQLGKRGKCLLQSTADVISLAVTTSSCAHQHNDLMFRVVF